MPIRIIIAKCRQLGFSTFFEAWLYHQCIFFEHVRAQVVAHLQKSTNRIAEIARIFNRELPTAIIDRCAASVSGNGLYWKDRGSMLEAVTQGSTEAARGDTPSAFHISELGLWDRSRSTTSAEDVLQASLSPLQDVDGTAVFIESTSGGAAGSFFQRYTDAVESHPIGGLWKPFFFSYQGVPKYNLTVRDDIARTHDEMLHRASNDDLAGAKRCATRLNYPQIWLERAIAHQLTAGETAWSIRTLRSKFRNDLDRFDQEFPISWQVAFVTSGRTVFDQHRILQHLRQPPPDDTAFGGRLHHDDDGNLVLDPMGDEWQFHVEPDPTHDYIVATDSAAGVTHGDYAAIRVWDRHARDFVATFYGYTDPQSLGQQAVHVARKYGGAYIIPEGNQHGWATVRAILDTGYRRLYRRDSGRTVRAGNNWADMYGFITNRRTRQIAIDHLADAIRNDTFTDPDRRFWQECTTYVYDANGKPTHMADKHDDAIMATALALFLDRELGPPVTRKPLTRKRPGTHDRFARRRRSNTRRDRHLGSRV